MKITPEKEILKLLREMHANLWLMNSDERLKDLNRRLDIIQGTQEEQGKRIQAFEKYFEVEFTRTLKYQKK